MFLTRNARAALLSLAALIGAVTAAAVVLFVVMPHGHPSAQCKRQFSQVVAAQSLASEWMNGLAPQELDSASGAFDPSAQKTISHYLHISGRLLHRMHAEGCPNDGYGHS